jgi:hypothetical protein
VAKGNADAIFTAALVLAKKMVEEATVARLLMASTLIH